MTRLPLDSWDVKGIPGPGYVANSVCAAPGCKLIVGEKHHLWRRSFLIGDYMWVELPDGAVSGNLVFLCQEHHQRVTEGKAVISLNGNQFVWTDGLVHQGYLQWQPPWFPSEQEFREYYEIHDSKPSEKTEGPMSETCPTCGRQTPAPAKKREQAKFRKAWSVAVPVGEQENGADVLDETLEDARHAFRKAGLSYGDADTVKYHVLATALTLFVAHADSILTTEGG